MCTDRWLLQLHDGDKMLPELIVEGEHLHDAQQAYCEFFEIDRNDTHGAHNNSWGEPWWKTSCPEHDYYAEPHLSHYQNGLLRPISIAAEAEQN
jgi:hypothetical protein